MNNIYFNELIKLVEDYEMFFHKKYYEVNCKGRRIYKNFEEYFEKRMEEKKQLTEKYNSPDREISEERQKEIRDSIINEETIKKEGIDFIVYTHKMKRHGDFESLMDLVSNSKKVKSHVVYTTSVIIHYEEKDGEFINARDIENLFVSIAKTQPKAIQNFEETCDLINNSTIEELMELIKNQIEKSKKSLAKRFEKELEERKK